MKKLLALTGALFLGTTLSANAALVVTGVSNADGPTDLVDAFLGSSSGITVVGTATYVGADNQGGTYTGFDAIPGLADGIVLSSGYANQVPLTNTDTSWDHNNLGLGSPQGQPGGSSDDADLVQVLLDSGNSQGVNDVNYLEFEFTVDDPAQNAVVATFVFGTEEYPDQSVTDIFAFIVDGVNYAFFPDGSLINFDEGGPNAAFYNDNTGGAFGIEWDGITGVLQVIGLLDAALTTHTLKIAIADTSDTIFDSAVYLAGLSALLTDDDDGGIDNPVIPVPAAFPLFAAGLAGLGFLRRRRKAS